MNRHRGKTNNVIIDLSFLPMHIISNVENQTILRRYERILERGRFAPKHFNCLRDLKFNDDPDPASTKLFKEVVGLRRFDVYGNSVRGEKIPRSGDQVIVRKSIFFGKHSSNLVDLDNESQELE